MEISQEKATFLPNPHAEREQCIKECDGCTKMFSDSNIGDVCVPYKNPKAKWRNYTIEKGTKKVKGKDVEILYHNSPCNFASHVKHSPKGKKIIQGKLRAGQQRHA